MIQIYKTIFQMVSDSKIMCSTWKQFELGKSKKINIKQCFVFFAHLDREIRTAFLLHGNPGAAAHCILAER